MSGNLFVHCTQNTKKNRQKLRHTLAALATEHSDRTQTHFKRRKVNESSKKRRLAQKKLLQKSK